MLQLNRSSFYYRPVGFDEATLDLMKRIDALFTRHPFFGSRQITGSLRRDGIQVGRHRVRRLMRLMGLETVYKRPNTSKPHPDHPVYPYLLKDRIINRPNQVWCADLTYIPVRMAFFIW